jgi:hypothetical protein
MTISLLLWQRRFVCLFICVAPSHLFQHEKKKEYRERLIALNQVVSDDDDLDDE